MQNAQTIKYIYGKNKDLYKKHAGVRVVIGKIRDLQRHGD